MIPAQQSSIQWYMYVSCVLSHFVLSCPENYDFEGIEASYYEARLDFSHLGHHHLGSRIPTGKGLFPSTSMVFLGLTYEMVAVTLEVPKDISCTKLYILRLQLSSARTSKFLIGKFSYVCTGINLWKMFMQHMLRDSVPIYFSIRPVLRQALTFLRTYAGWIIFSWLRTAFPFLALLLSSTPALVSAPTPVSSGSVASLTAVFSARLIHLSSILLP